jgi:hypothetical protein
VANGNLPNWILEQEARALRTRLARVKPFALLEPMLPAASISAPAQTAIERYLAAGRRELRGRINGFLKWLHTPEGRTATPEVAQRRFTMLRMRFNIVLSQFDLFADVITQRSEHESGVHLAGLDVVARDALDLRGGYYQVPPIICYLDRGPGAAIRRARTRMPGGSENPVAVVRVPRERMVGSGIASSLIHEAGHQGAALLELVETLRPILKERAQAGGGAAWQMWERWVSEIIADFWSVAHVGVGATLGLMAVVSLPRAFVMRFGGDDPHPIPWIRVKLSCAMGRALYPHEQWDKAAALWEGFYPLGDLAGETRQLFAELEASMPEFVELLLNHRPPKLRGATLAEAMPLEERSPERLREHYERWRREPRLMRAARPALVFAVIGQVRIEGRISPEKESRMLAYLLTYWAMRSTLNTTEFSARHSALREEPAPSAVALSQ